MINWFISGCPKYLDCIQYKQVVPFSRWKTNYILLLSFKKKILSGVYSNGNEIGTGKPSMFDPNRAVNLCVVIIWYRSLYPNTVIYSDISYVNTFVCTLISRWQPCVVWQYNTVVHILVWELQLSMTWVSNTQLITVRALRLSTYRHCLSATDYLISFSIQWF